MNATPGSVKVSITVVKDMLKTMAAAGNTLATPKAKIVKNCVYNTRY